MHNVQLITHHMEGMRIEGEREGGKEFGQQSGKGASKPKGQVHNWLDYHAVITWTAHARVLGGAAHLGLTILLTYMP